jgi:hypothetical protein
MCADHWMKDAHGPSHVLDLRKDVEHQEYAEENQRRHQDGAGVKAAWLPGLWLRLRGPADEPVSNIPGVVEATVGAVAQRCLVQCSAPWTVD